MELFVFIGSLFLLLALGVPIAVALIGCALVLMFTLGSFDLNLLGQQMISGVNNFSLMAIPFFMLAGELMAKGGLSKRIVDFANVLLGRVRGGLGYTAILASIIFAGLSGSAVADAAALGAILLPLMKEQGYRTKRAGGLICASSIIAPIIPPSIPMILVGTTVGLSVTRLFMSGLVPGIIMGLALMVVWRFVVRADDYHDTVKFSGREAFKTVIQSIPALFMPVLIVGGIRLGFFTPTEAGAFAVVYAIIASAFIYRELSLKQFWEAVRDAGRSTAAVMFIAGGAAMVAWLITVAQIPAKAVALFGGLVNHPIPLLLTINLFLFLMGMVLDIVPNILIFAPVLFPVIMQAGIDPYFFALIMVLNLSIGLITPPVGTVLFVGCGVAKIKFMEIVQGTIPFLITELVILIIFIFCPQLILAPLEFLM